MVRDPLKMSPNKVITMSDMVEPAEADATSPVSTRKRKFDKLERPYLPIDGAAPGIVKILRSTEVHLFAGETGSGKSTQLPKLCLRAGWCKAGGRVAITQPRRVAAISLALRVAEEMGVNVGAKVGYRVRFEACASEATRLLYMTDGILLREAMVDPLLKEYAGVVIDEAHERSLHSDVLLAVVRRARRLRAKKMMPVLRVVIMSATLESKLFTDYFKIKDLVNIIKGRAFPVEIYYADDIDPTNNDYLHQAIQAVMQVHQEQPITSDILVFLTGREEIDMAVKKVQKLCESEPHKIHAVALYAAMTPQQQMKAFSPAPAGERKVIFSTNIAETSVTIPGVRIVIDSGKVKMKTFTVENRIDVLKVHTISKAQSTQRAGRAGREAPGICYRLYPKAHRAKMATSTVAEILRSNIVEVLMELLKIGWRNIENLKLIEQPEPEAIKTAINQLEAMKAITRTEDSRWALTETGNHLLKFPVPPEHARVILAGANNNCLEEVLWIVACMSAETVFSSEKLEGSEDDTRRIRDRYRTNEGDHLTMLNVCNAFRAEKRKRKGSLLEFCRANGFHMRNLNTILKIRNQLREAAKEICDMTSCGANRDKIRRALADGLYMNACVYDRQEDRYRLLVNPSVVLRIHPSSALARSKPGCFIFTELVRTSDLYARDVTIVDEEWVRANAEAYKKKMFDLAA